MSEILIKAPRKVFKKGETIFTQGETGDEMYIIQKGLVSIDIHSRENRVIPLGEFGPKNFFGEMALFDDPKRTATATAIEETSVLVINNQTMKFLLSKLPPWFVTMFKEIVSRLREADIKLMDELTNETNRDTSE